VKTPEDENQ